MLGGAHLHIDRGDSLSGLLAKTLASAKSGALEIRFAEEPAARVTANDGDITVDLLQPSAFRVPDDETGLIDKLKTASEFARQLSDSGATLSILRKGKEAVKLGKDARPTLSRLMTGSGDIQMSSVRELARLKGDLKTEGDDDD